MILKSALYETQGRSSSFLGSVIYANPQLDSKIARGEVVETRPERSARKLSQWLQLGHGSEAVETWLRSCSVRAGDMLQWGHGSEAVETSGSTVPSWQSFSLQWGHGSEAVETVCADRNCASGSNASMGPRL